jgi:hypothetical protein
MAISLLELKDGGVSLEFAEEDVDDLVKAIQERFGEIQTVKKLAAHDLVEFGAEQFIYYYEWDPCLISQSPRGAEMLQEILLQQPASPITSGFIQ